MADNDIITLGIDPSLNGTGWAIMRNKDLVETGVLKMKQSMSGAEKRSSICYDILALIKKWDPEVYGIEEARVFHSTTTAAVSRALGVVEGAIYSYAAIYGAMPTIIDAHPQKARSVFGMGGGADKARILLTVRSVFPDVKIPDHNAADAVVVANFAYHTHMNNL